MPYGKASWWPVFQDGIAMDLSFHRTFYDASLSHAEEMRATLAARWSRAAKDHPQGLPSHIEDDLIDENYTLAQVERQIHNAASILLASLAERWIDQLERRVERSIDGSADTFTSVGKSRPDLSFFGKYLAGHQVIFDKDYLHGAVAHRRELVSGAFLDESLWGDIPEVDGRFLDDFIWLRNKIVHSSGVARKTQLQPTENYSRRIPVEAVDGDEDEEPTRFRLTPDSDYLTEVARQFIALFAELVADASPRIGRGYWNEGE